MTEEVAALVVRLEATQARFERDLQRASRSMDREAGRIERRAQQMDQRVSASTRRMGRNFNGSLQNIGFQVGDFATQIASGQNALVAFTQQGTQLISAFGPIGAILGAVGATAGALAVAFFNAGEEAQSLTDVMGGLSDAGSRVDSLNAQIANSSGVVRSALIAERDATVDLLKARLELARTALAERQTEVERDTTARAEELARSQNVGASRRSSRTGNARAREVLEEAAVALREQARSEVVTPELRVELAGLERQIAQTTVGSKSWQIAQSRTPGRSFRFLRGRLAGVVDRAAGAARLDQRQGRASLPLGLAASKTASKRWKMNARCSVFPSGSGCGSTRRLSGPRSYRNWRPRPGRTGLR